MALKKVAVVSMTLSLTTGVTGVGQALGPASAFVAVGGKGVYCNGLSVTFTSFTHATLGVAPGSSASFSATATRTRSDGTPVLRVGDAANFGTLNFVSGGTTTPLAVAATISDAGQTSVDAE